MAQKLNPNNAAFDPVFAAKYRNRRAQEDPHYLHFQAQKRQLKLQGRLHWVQKSAFTAEEHGYLLDLGGENPVCFVLGSATGRAMVSCAEQGWAMLCCACCVMIELCCAGLCRAAVPCYAMHKQVSWPCYGPLCTGVVISTISSSDTASAVL